MNAVEAALELQAKMAEANQSVTEHRRILLRIGINLGDVIGEGSDIYGDGVNVAARLEALAEPGGVCISAKVHEELRGKGDPAFEDMGEVELKNIARPVRVYRVGTNTGQARRAGRNDAYCQTLHCRAAIRQPERRSQPAIPFGRHHGGHHHRVVALQKSHRRGTSRFVPSRRHGHQPDAGRPRSGRELCRRRQCAEGGRADSHYCPADRRQDRQPRLGRAVRSRMPTTFLLCRTKSSQQSWRRSRGEW